MWFAVSVIAVVAVLYFLYRDSVKPDGFPPGPKWRPIVGCHFEIKLMMKRFGFHYLVLDALAQAYGSVVGLRLGRDRIILVSKQEHVKKVLQREEFDGRPDGFFFRMRSYQQRLGIAFTDGPHYQEQKRFCLTALKKMGMGKQAMEGIIMREARELILAVAAQCEINPILEINKIFDAPVINGLWSLTTGRRFDLQDRKLSELMNLVHEAFRTMDMSGGVLNQMPFLRFVAPNATGYNTIRLVVNRFDDFLKEVVREQEGSGPSEDNLVGLFLTEMKSREGTESTFTVQQLMTLLLDLFMAGSETTSNTLTTAVLYMVMYPEIQAKVHRVIDSVVPAGRLPDLRDRPSLGYVEAVVLEVLRHATIVPVSVAHRSIESVSYQGFTIPKDSTILINLRSVLMDKDHWGDPENFRPERFQDEKGGIIQDEWFYPFGQGKRRCIGEGLARTNMFLLFAAFMQNFRLSATRRRPSLTPRDGITLSPQPFEALISVRKSGVEKLSG